MTNEERAKHLAFREAQAAKILAKPNDFKVCEQCLSIAFKQAAICPVCHAYSWLTTPRAVEIVAEYCSKQMFPVTAAVAPRLNPIKLWQAPQYGAKVT